MGGRVALVPVSMVLECELDDGCCYAVIRIRILFSSFALTCDIAQVGGGLNRKENINNNNNNNNQ